MSVSFYLFIPLNPPKRIILMSGNYKEIFRLRKLPNLFNRSPENRNKNIMLLATIVCIILSKATENHCNFCSGTATSRKKKSADVTIIKRSEDNIINHKGKS